MTSGNGSFDPMQSADDPRDPNAMPFDADHMEGQSDRVKRAGNRDNYGDSGLDDQEDEYQADTSSDPSQGIYGRGGQKYQDEDNVTDHDLDEPADDDLANDAQSYGI